MFTWSRLEIWLAVVLAALIVVGGTGHLLLAHKQGQRTIVVEAGGEGRTPTSSFSGRLETSGSGGTLPTVKTLAPNAGGHGTGDAGVSGSKDSDTHGSDAAAGVASETAAVNASGPPGDGLESADNRIASVDEERAADEELVGDGELAGDVGPEADVETGEVVPDSATVKQSSLFVAETININQAQPSELQRLPGIGPALAARIVAYREAWGPFGAIEDILEVSGIGPVKFANMQHMLAVD